MKINDNKIVDGLTPDGSYQDRIEVPGQERAGTGIPADTFNQIIREFQENYIVKAGLTPSSEDLDQFYEATKHFVSKWLETDLSSLSEKIESNDTDINNLMKEILGTRSLRVGEITAWAGLVDTIPNNAYLCDDTLLLIADHQALFNAIEHSWRNGRTPTEGYFYLPDGRGGVLKGAGSSSASKYPNYYQSGYSRYISIVENRGLAGTYQSTAIVNIKGETRMRASRYGVGEGAFEITNQSGDVAEKPFSQGLVLNTSRVAPAGATNRDNNLAVNWIIFYKA